MTGMSSVSPAAGHMSRGRSSSSSSDTTRAVAVVLAAVVAVIGGFLGSGAVVGTPIDQAAGGALSASATLVAPAGPAFSIWSVIYAGLLALAVYQLLPAQRHDARQRATGWWVVASLLLNAAWILIAQAGSVTGALVVIVALLAVLVVAFVRLTRTGPVTGTATTASRPPVQRVLLDGVIGLYLGWVSIATVANAAAVLVAVGGLPVTDPLATTLAVVVLIVAAGIGWLLAVGGRGRVAPALSLAWGLVWIAVGRWSGQPEAPVVSVVAVVAALAVMAATLVVRVRHPTND
ncbi:TspO and MBR related proteins [Quadrisphaera granulorum]|uniref:TspO/MBR related protein n=1 Tax=Quadrisphaera granulorum TaxID=317664 RepID=A0A316AAL2_9ACTN|nr:tryptophan-rich sensory protein [Quadrisphaera granulorum]PWJ54040.1 TspO/MBR related protein [Quadrisphaera granulorum]SZE96497.1 TspO and MBR related proteins [Quadrisphaera granulorum]